MIWGQWSSHLLVLSAEGKHLGTGVRSLSSLALGLLVAGRIPMLPGNTGQVAVGSRCGSSAAAKSLPEPLGPPGQGRLPSAGTGCAGLPAACGFFLSSATDLLLWRRGLCEKTDSDAN